MARLNVLRGLCGRFLNKLETDTLVGQVARVLFLVGPGEDDLPSEIFRPEDVGEIFRSNRLISPQLINVLNGLQDRYPNMHATSLGITFAACIYPQMAYRQGERLQKRVESFIGFLEDYERFNSPINTLKHRLANSPDLSEVLPHLYELLGDLSGAKTGLENGEELLNGAAFYLGSCHPHQLKLIWENWQKEHNFLRVFRSWFASPPSMLKPKRDIETYVGHDNYQKACDIEKAARGAAKTWPRSIPRIPYFQDAWEGLYEKINSGFPHYAFLSSFKYWWSLLFKYYSFDRLYYLEDQLQQPNDLQLPIQANIDSSPWWEAALTPARNNNSQLPIQADTDSIKTTIDELFFFREGYRLVRTTFFARDHGPPTTEEVRRALDLMWQSHWEQVLISGERRWGELTPLLNGLIQAEFSTLKRDALESMNNRLRLRMWGYTLGRWNRLTNDEIKFRRPPLTFKDGVGKYPLLNEKTAITVASLAKAAARDNSLLGPFTAYVFLRPLLNPRLATDRWDFNKLLQELWYWLTSQYLERSLEYGAQCQQVDGALLEILETEPFQSLIRDLANLPEADLPHYIDTKPIPSLQSKALKLLVRMAGNQGVHFKSGPCKRCLNWGNQDGQVPIHWVIPVWYLIVLEKLSPEDTCRRLKVSPEEQAVVLRLANQLQQCRIACPGVEKGKSHGKSKS